MDLVKLEQWSLIKLPKKEGIILKEIHNHIYSWYLQEVFANLIQNKILEKAIQIGKESVEGNPKLWLTVECCDKECVTWWRLWCWKIPTESCFLAYELGICVDTFFHICQETLVVYKVNLLGFQNVGSISKRNWLEIYIENLELFKHDCEHFSILMISHETWLHPWNPETKPEGLQWIDKRSPTPCKFCVKICR